MILYIYIMLFNTYLVPFYTRPNISYQFFMVFSWWTYVYYCFAAELHENFKECEVINWKWLYIDAKIMDFNYYNNYTLYVFCVYYFIWYQLLPALN